MNDGSFAPIFNEDNQTLEIMFNDDSYTLPNTNIEMDFTKTRTIEDYN